MNYFAKLGIFFWICVTFFTFAGCYTVLSNPYSVKTMNELESDSGYSTASPSEDSQGSSQDGLDDFYRYPGSSGGYGVYGGRGYPVGGYYGGPYGGSYYGGGYGAYGYSGYSPYSYGYDPYYSNDNNYIPPGYELISNQELDEIRASLIELRNKPVVVDPNSEAEAADLREDVWLRRTQPHMRRVPVVGQERTSSYVPSSTPSTSKSPSGRTVSTQSTPASKSTSEKSSAQPKKKRR